MVKPGTQTRRFTHIDDTINTCFDAWKKINVNIIVFRTKRVSLLKDVAKMFGSKIKFLPSRPGERYASALTKMNLSNKVVRNYGKISLRDYILSFKNSVKKPLNK